jgi:iron complex outermembrane receptor protein
MRIVLCFLFVCATSLLIAQSAEIRGTVTDNMTKQPVTGAKITINGQYRAVSDVNGVYSIENVPFGTYPVVVALISFDTLKVTITVESTPFNFDFVLGGSKELEEVKVIGNFVSDRKTPVAVTKLTAQKITEELGSRDLPMLLNGTPGVYATQTGGGDGDSRINVRGFDQRNVGVLIDGVPVNDMENGWVYWSNWFGLDAITSNIQVQRGLGATKLAMPSIGGTINILTTGSGNKKMLSFKQEYGTGNLLRSSLTYNSGILKKGWSVTASASYKQGDGWVYGTPTQGFFGYAKVQKRIKNHLISLSAFAAPQQHGQRSYSQSIQYWSTQDATNMHVPIDNSAQFINEGIRFNQHWGYRTEDGKRKIQNENLNYYNKPQITLKDFWKINSKWSLSNILYTSIGRGGGTRLSNANAALRDSDKLINWDGIIQENKVNSLFGTPNIDPLYSPTLIKSSQVLLNTVNNHFWLGYLGQFNYDYSKKLKFSGGLDLRYYKGTHYQEIRDMLGGDYYIETSNQNTASPMRFVGDKVAMKSFNSYRDGLVNWAGLFGQAEYTGARWTFFVNLSGVVNGYKGIDYFQKKMLQVGDSVLRIGINDTITYQGQTYTSQSAGIKDYQTDWKYIPGGTLKFGGSYSLTEHSTVFVNAGFLSRTPQFSNVIDNNYNAFFKEILNEQIIAFEGGYSFATKKWGFNINGYYTDWRNKPFPFGVLVPDPNDPTQSIAININGMNALHIGGELDVAYKLNKKWSGDVMVSVGNWTWRSAKTVFVPQYNYSISFDARGVHVGDAAQTALAASVRYEPIKNLFVKVQAQFFDRYYSQFNPFTLQGDNAQREAWKIPAYGLINLFAGYKYGFKNVDLLFNGSITNLLNTQFIAEANDNKNAPYVASDALSATVMYGGGFRFNLSLAIQF